MPPLGYFKSNAGMTINKFESRGRKWVTDQKKECERKANRNENRTRTLAKTDFKHINNLPNCVYRSEQRT